MTTHIGSRSSHAHTSGRTHPPGSGQSTQENTIPYHTDTQFQLEPRHRERTRNGVTDRQCIRCATEHCNDVAPSGVLRDGRVTMCAQSEGQVEVHVADFKNCNNGPLETPLLDAACCPVVESGWVYVSDSPWPLPPTSTSSVCLRTACYSESIPAHLPCSGQAVPHHCCVSPRSSQVKSSQTKSAFLEVTQLRTEQNRTEILHSFD